MQQTPVAPAADGVARFAPSDDADAPDAGGANLFFVATMYKAPGKAFEKKEYALKARGSLSGDEADGALATFAKATLDLAPHATLDHGAPSRVIRVRLADPRSRAKGVEVALAVAVTWLRNHVQDQDGMTDLSGVSGLSSNRGGESSGASDITGLDSLGGDAAEQDLEGFEEEGAAAKNPEEETSGIASFFGLFGAATSAAAPPMSPIADVDSPSKEMSTPAKRGDERSREERVDDEAPPPPPTVAFGWRGGRHAARVAEPGGFGRRRRRRRRGTGPRMFPRTPPRTPPRRCRPPRRVGRRRRRRWVRRRRRRRRARRRALMRYRSPSKKNAAPPSDGGDSGGASRVARAVKRQIAVGRMGLAVEGGGGGALGGPDGGVSLLDELNSLRDSRTAMEEDLRAAETELQKRHRVAIKAAVDAQRDLQHVQKRELAARLEEALRLETEELEKAWEERAESRGGGAAARGEGAEGGDDGEDEASADLPSAALPSGAPSASDASALDDATPFALAKLRDELAAARSDSARARDERDASAAEMARLRDALNADLATVHAARDAAANEAERLRRELTTPRPRERSGTASTPGKALGPSSRRRVPFAANLREPSRALLVSPPGTRGERRRLPARALAPRVPARAGVQAVSEPRRRSASRGARFRARGVRDGLHARCDALDARVEALGRELAEARKEAHVSTEAQREHAASSSARLATSARDGAARGSLAEAEKEAANEKAARHDAERRRRRAKRSGFARPSARTRRR